MPNKVINLQDTFLNQVRKENVPVTIHLVNGFQIKGNVKGFDNFTVVLDVLENSRWYINMLYLPLHRLRL